LCVCVCVRERENATYSSTNAVSLVDLLNRTTFSHCTRKHTQTHDDRQGWFFAQTFCMCVCVWADTNCDCAVMTTGFTFTYLARKLRLGEICPMDPTMFDDNYFL
jgi:hypothetical protein